jgi:hypothetical protein
VGEENEKVNLIYHVVLIDTALLPVCNSFSDRTELLDYVKSCYVTIKNRNATDTRIYIFSGSRIRLTGGSVRKLIFEDGTVEVLSGPQEPPSDTDLLLAPPDSITLPP